MAVCEQHCGEKQIQWQRKLVSQVMLIYSLLYIYVHTHMNTRTHAQTQTIETANYSEIQIFLDSM